MTKAPSLRWADIHNYLAKDTTVSVEIPFPLSREGKIVVVTPEEEIGTLGMMKVYAR